MEGTGTLEGTKVLLVLLVTEIVIFKKFQVVFTLLSFLGNPVHTGQFLGSANVNQKIYWTPLAFSLFTFFHHLYKCYRFGS